MEDFENGFAVLQGRPIPFNSNFIKSKDPKKEEKKEINPDIEEIFKLYGIIEVEIESVLEKLINLEGLELTNCEVVSCLNEKIKQFLIACWYIKIKDSEVIDRDEDKVKVEIFEDPELNNLYFRINLFFPKEFWQTSQKMYLIDEIKPEEVLKKGINVFLKRILESKVPQL